jgi:Histidine kinase/Histidine kinase-, DNA gyrase B-, and HSP90-like ATPase
MAASIASPVTRSPARRPHYLARAARSVGYGLIAGLCIALLRAQSLWSTLIYSICIAIACWFCIDLGRRVVAAWLNRRFGIAVTEWPGLPWLIPIILVGSALGFFGGTELADWITGNHTPSLALTRDPRQTLADLLTVEIPAIVITFFFYSRSVIADREAAVQAAQRQAAESRLRLLEAQLEPHMFFNTLANLHVLIGLDPPRAQAMLDQLVSFLRATLSASLATEHPLRAEFARTRDYIALMQVRMEDRLRAQFDLPPELAEIRVPPLLLQPIVENSIKHGLEPSITGGLIEVAAKQDGGSLVITVRDTGVGIDSTSGGGERSKAPESAGFGLQQVRERLATHYGAKASFTLTAAGEPEGGTLAVVRVPLATDSRVQST